jgi:hypothetical protein
MVCRVAICRLVWYVECGKFPVFVWCAAAGLAVRWREAEQNKYKPKIPSLSVQYTVWYSTV